MARLVFGRFAVGDGLAAPGGLHLGGRGDHVVDTVDRGCRALDMRLIDVVGVQRQRQGEHRVELAQARDV